MSGSINGSSTGSGNRVDPYDLSYGEVTTFSSGGIISKQMKMDLRKQYGYCATCPLVPVQLVDVRRSKINPLWISKKPLTREGESLEGRCLKCFPDRDVTPGKTRPTLVATPSFHSRSTQSFASSISSCSIGSFGSQNVLTAASDQTCNQRGVAKTVSAGSQQNGIIHRESTAMLPPRPLRTNSEDSTSHRFGSMRRTGTPLRREALDTESIVKTNGSTKSVRYTNTDIYTLSESTYHDPVEYAPTVSLQLVSTEEAKLVSVESSVVNLNTSVICDSSLLLKIAEMLQDLKKSNNVSIFTECLLSTMDANRFDESIQSYCLDLINQELLSETMDCSTFFDLSGPSRILDALKAFSDSLDVLEKGCDALATLVANESDLSKMIRQGVCESLCRVLGLHSTAMKIAGTAFEAIRILSAVYEARKRMIDLDLSRSVVEVMQLNLSSSAIQQDGCAILSNLSVDVHSKSVSVVEKSDLKAIVEAMKFHCSDEAVLASGCFALRNYTYNSENLRSMNETPNIIQVLEKAASFESLIVSAEHSLELLYVTLAEEESLKYQAPKDFCL